MSEPQSKWYKYDGDLDNLREFVSIPTQVAGEMGGTGGAVFSHVCGWMRVPVDAVVLRLGNDEYAVMSEHAAKEYGYVG